MKRFIVTWTDDYYSGGPSLSSGFIGDFPTWEEAILALKKKRQGSCTAADILDQKLRIVHPFVEGNLCKEERL